MTATKYIVTTFVGRQKRYLFGTGKTAANKLQAEYSTQKVDAEIFDTQAEAKAFIKNLSNPYDRVFATEPTEVAETPLEELMATLPVVVDEKKIDRKTVIKKAKKIR
jgi:hypothetical protein